MLNQGKSIFVRLDQLYLDPNNYRFVDNKNYKPVDENLLTDERIQNRTYAFVAGEKRQGIRDLITSFKENGYLSVDQIQVKPLSDEKYLVLEGNRRVSALRALREDFNSNLDIGKLDSDIFKSVPVVTYANNSEADFYILTGLKHIEGNKKWPTVNQAQLVSDLVNKHHLSEDEVIARLGTSKIRVRRYIRSLSLIDQYVESDYGDQFTSDMYSIFEEIIKRPSIKEWIGWDDDFKKAQNNINLERLFSWLSKEEIRDDDLDELGNEIVRTRDRIITKAFDVRELGTFIEDPKAIDEMEKSGNINAGYLSNSQILTDKFNKSIELASQYVKEAFSVSEYTNEESYKKLQDLKNQLNGLIVSHTGQSIVDQVNIRRHYSFLSPENHLLTIFVKKYKGISGVEIDNLNKINVIVGNNNSGKTSFLEAVYLLINQNNLDGYFDLWRRRSKMSNLNINWLTNEYENNVEIEGVFDTLPVEVQYEIEEEDSVEIDKTSYVSTIFVNGRIGARNQESQARLFEDKQQEVYYSRVEPVCRLSMSTPFYSHLTETILSAHAESIKTRSITKIISFIRDNIDKGIEDITLSEDNGIKRFNVIHSDFPDKSIDLTQFGDGLQRIFNISLHFSLAADGILLIDEFENAIHYQLLEKFTKFVQELSNEFNVQIFVTTHSKECVDAFVNNGYANDDITFFQLSNEEKRVKRINAEKYIDLIESVDVDIRKVYQ